MKRSRILYFSIVVLLLAVSLMAFQVMGVSAMNTAGETPTPTETFTPPVDTPTSTETFTPPAETPTTVLTATPTSIVETPTSTPATPAEPTSTPAQNEPPTNTPAPGATVTDALTSTLTPTAIVALPVTGNDNLSVAPFALMAAALLLAAAGITVLWRLLAKKA